MSIIESHISHHSISYYYYFHFLSQLITSQSLSPGWDVLAWKSFLPRLPVNLATQSTVNKLNLIIWSSPKLSSSKTLEQTNPLLASIVVILSKMFPFQGNVFRVHQVRSSTRGEAEEVGQEELSLRQLLRGHADALCCPDQRGMGRVSHV